VSAAGVDPIEKKPLFHANPGARIFSFAIAGCNLSCPWCQNHQMSQWAREHRAPFLPGEKLTPADLVARAVASGCRWIAATYTEPTVFFEYALEVARLARAAGLKNAWVTNGTIEQAPLAELVPFLDAANVDLKCHGDLAAEKLLGIRSAHVGETIRAMIAAGVSTEVTTCLVPGFNDAPEHLAKIIAFMASLGPSGIWHVSRYHPMYQWEAPPTDLASLRSAVAAGRAAGIPYIYAGNARLDAGENTRCPACNALLVERDGYRVLACRVTPAGACPDCGAKIPGVWGVPDASLTTP
jgi:pyruvate formate lyase activating enzyme